jgi:hypothetical protein
MIFQTPLETMRFLECLVEATNDLFHPSHAVDANEFIESIKAQTLKLWLDTTKTEVHAVRWLLPEDTPVFTCPFPLAGCTYQTTTMQQWVVHKDKCRKRRWDSRLGQPDLSKTEKTKDSIHAIRYVRMLENYSPRGESSGCFWARSRDQRCADSFSPSREGPGNSRFSYISGIRAFFLSLHQQDNAPTDYTRPPRSPPALHHRLFFETIYRIVWLELLRLFGLFMLSVLPLCTNVLGFVVCWLTILRSVSMWKGKGILLLST